MIRGEMMERMSAREFREWLALESLSPEQPSAAERAVKVQSAEELLAMFPVTKKKKERTRKQYGRR